MIRKCLRSLAAVLLGGLAVSLALAAPAPGVTKGTITDRASFIPKYKFQPLQGKAIGLLLSNVAPKMGHEGRSGAIDNMGFSAGGASYRWIYVPVKVQPQITGLQVAVGEKGDRKVVYQQLSMANARTVAQWDIKVPYALVEVEVNDGQASPADEGFVATKMTRLDGTKEYPLNVADVMNELPKKYAAWKKEQQGKLDEAMADAQKKAIKDRKPTGPRETTELVYATWMPDTKRMRVHFRTTLTDGEYKFTPGGRFNRDPLPLPPPGGRQGFAAFPPPPPPDVPPQRYGTSFGIEFGLAFEINTDGKIVRELTLTAEPFKTELPAPLGGPRRPFELPPPPRQ